MGIKYIINNNDGTLSSQSISGKLSVTSLQITSGSTPGYVLTALDSDGNMNWQVPTGGGTFTGNTSASCISDLYITNLHGCSPIILHDVLSGNSTNNYIDLLTNTDTIKIQTKYSSNDWILGLGSNYNGVYLGTLGTNLQLFPGSSSLYNATQMGINVNGGTINQHSSYGCEVVTPSTGSLFLVKTNNSDGQNLVNNDFYGGALQSEIVVGRPNTANSPLALGVMGTGIGDRQTGGTEYNPIFLSTPRTYSYDTVSYSTIKNVLFGGGSDNKVYTGVTNSALIGGSGNTINTYIKNTVILGGELITGNTSNSVYVPDLIIKKSASIPTTSGDTIGEVGSVTWDNNYIYVKTVSGWGRTLLNYSW